MAIAVRERRPVAHLPLVLGMLRNLEVAAVIDRLRPPHPDNVLSCGTGVEALVVAILDGHQVLYKGGQRLEERGRLSLLPPGLQRASLNAYRLGQILDAWFAATLHKVCSALALPALAIYALPTLWMQQDTTTMTLYGAYEGLAQPMRLKADAETDKEAAPGAPRPAPGYHKEGPPARKQVLLRLGGSGAGGRPLRLGLRDGNPSESTEPPLAIEEGRA